jgi:hypothetical protein
MSDSLLDIQRRERLLQICATLPEVTVSGEQHLTFQVRSKTFAYYLNDHHGDGRIALCCKAYPGDLEALIAFDPLRFYVPAYLGPKGWVGLRLDLPEVDWEQVAERVRIAYRLVAPKRLAAQVAPSAG